ncbi:MAG TPA: hypothetical protein VFD76_04635 [Gemmatimonadales bacterium]|nr:hypothetical protein [Gemmatimonadales bacterium]
MKEFETHDALDLARVAVLFGPPCMVLLSAAWFSLLATGAISGRTFFWLLGANIPITAAAVGVVFLVVRTSAVGVAHMATAAGNIAPPPSYPNQDLLIAQGKYGEAADYFRDHIRITPEDLDARVRLADLLERHLGDLAGAEQQYLAVRRLGGESRLQTAATNGLIDVYRKQGRRDQLMVELARLAEGQRGTALGAGAARELRELKMADGG